MTPSELEMRRPLSFRHALAITLPLIAALATACTSDAQPPPASLNDGSAAGGHDRDAPLSEASAVSDITSVDEQRATPDAADPSEGGEGSAPAADAGADSNAAALDGSTDSTPSTLDAAADSAMSTFDAGDDGGGPGPGPTQQCAVTADSNGF